LCRNSPEYFQVRRFIVQWSHADLGRQARRFFCTGGLSGAAGDPEKSQHFVSEDVLQPGGVSPCGGMTDHTEEGGGGFTSMKIFVTITIGRFAF
jgi:hypothetical protein